MLKIFIKSLCPPILWSFLQKIRFRIIQNRKAPKWTKVRSGPIANSELFVNEETALFASMIDGTYDSFFWKCLNETHVKGGLVVDVGGHIGYHSLAFASLVGPTGKVVVFEPNVHNRERMEMNFRRNAELSRRIEVRPYAVANIKGAVKFTFSTQVDDQTSSGGYIEISQRSFHESVYKQFTTETVPVEKLDDVISGDLANSLRLIKIDVEGAEGLVLEGAKNILGKCRPMLMIEIHSVSAMDAVYKILIPLGYRLSIVDVDRDSRCFIFCVC